MVEGCGAPSTDVDHNPSRRVLIAQGVRNPDAAEHLFALCHSHHSSKTANEDRSWGVG